MAAPQKPVKVVAPPPTPPQAPPEVPTPAPPPKPKHHTKKSPKRTRWVIIGFVALVIIALGITAGYFAIKSLKPNASQSNSSQTANSGSPTIPGISFPLYYPSNLPPGYTFNKDTKVLKNDVLYYSIADPKGNNYYVTLQPVPASFNFTAFNSKFLKPDQFTTNIGSVVAGQVGANYIASIQTNSNVWIIINSSNKDSLTPLEAISRSFQQAK